MNSALVAGATGFIGTNLVEELLSAGVATWGLLRVDSPHRGRVERLDGFRPIHVTGYGTDELERAFASIRVDVVYNALGAGVSHDDRRWELLLDGNVRAAADVARFSAGRARRLVHVGTCSEYGPKPPEATPIVESDPVDPRSDYGAAKAAARPILVHLCRTAGIEYVHARLFNTFGLHERAERIVPFVASRLLANEPADLTSGEQIRDFTFAADVVGALRLLGECTLPEETATVNVCSRRETRVRELAVLVAEILGAPAERLRFGAKAQRADEPIRIVGNNDRLRRFTGWEPETNLETGVRRVIEAVRAANPTTEAVR